MGHPYPRSASRMVKVRNTRITNKQQRKAKQSGRTPVARMPTAASLDAHATAFAKLLANPCASPLAHPVYAGSDAGILVRTESAFSVYTAAGATAGAVHWVPGAVSSDSGNLLSGVDGGTFAKTAFVPGLTYIKAQASAARCVAACMQITFLGSELNRSGVIAIGRASGDLVKVGDSVSAAGLEPSLEHYTRTPDKTIELTWVPGMDDQSFLDPNANFTADMANGRSALAFCAYGLPAAVGIRVRLVAVYEYKPLQATGITYTSSARAKSKNSLDHVLNEIQEATNKVREVGATAYKVFQVGKRIAGMLI